MTMTVRNVELTNPSTTNPVAAGSASTAIGQDYSGIIVRRYLTAGDIGTNAGQTQDAAGMIFAEIYGGAIQGVTSLQVFRPSGAEGSLTYLMNSVTNVPFKPGFSFSTTGGISTLRLRDGGATTGLLAAGDMVVMTVEVGNS